MVWISILKLILAVIASFYTRILLYLHTICVTLLSLVNLRVIYVILVSKPLDLGGYQLLNYCLLDLIKLFLSYCF